MTIRRVTSPDVPEPPPERWSNCLVCDGIAYVSGMTARGTDAAMLAKMDEYEQAKQIFGKIKGMVEAAGGTMADVVKVIDLRHQHQEQHQGLEGPGRVLHRQLPGLDAGPGGGARGAGDPGRDRGDRAYRQGRALSSRSFDARLAA